MKCFEIKDVVFTYPEGGVKTLNGFSLDIEEGEFVALCGSSGCGKSTLLRRLKPGLEDSGTFDGEILFYGKPLSAETDGGKIGFVMQNPDMQVKYKTVKEELERYLDRETLGNSADARVAEMVCFFGIQQWYEKEVGQLSGGQKQLMNLASVMAASPDVLILDEPTSQLDPIAASEFIAAVGRINRELGTTVIITEHRLDEVLPIASVMAVMDSGKLIASGAPEETGRKLKKMGHGMFSAMPVPMRVFTELSENDEKCPISVRDGRLWLEEYAEEHSYTQPVKAPPPEEDELAVFLKNIWFRYSASGNDVVKGAEFRARFGKITAIVGGNGTGKSTTASIIVGKNRPYRGKVTIAPGKMTYMPQNPLDILTSGTLYEDLELPGKTEEEIKEAAEKCMVTEYLGREAKSLSGGEQQRAALAKVLLEDGDIMVLDEPTKGMDSEFKERFAGIMRQCAKQGKAVIIVSHDLEFCAQYADKCAMFFDGWIVAAGESAGFFKGNNFYTTAASRMARRIMPDAVTPGDITGAFMSDK